MNQVQTEFEQIASAIVKRAKDRLSYSTAANDRVEILKQMKDELSSLKDAYSVILDSEFPKISS